MVAANLCDRWKKLCILLGCAALAEDANYAVNSNRVKDREKLHAILKKCFKEKTTEEWVKLFEAEDILCRQL